MDYEISTDRGRVDVGRVWEFLRNSYWAKGIPREVVERSIEHSLCFGAYLGKEQVGFARVVSDFATVAYLADVFVIEAHRGRGVSKKMMEAIKGHPELQGLRRWILVTKDAHGLYEQFGFEGLGRPEDFMTIHRAGVYQKKAE